MATSALKIINVNAISLDGKIGRHPLESDALRRTYGFTNKADQEFVRSQLQNADAVITGANSLRASGGAWEVVNTKGRCATWVVMTQKGLESDLRLWSQHRVDKWIVSPQEISIPSESVGVKIMTYGNESPARVVVEALKQAGYERVLLFGGGYINRIFYDEGLVDEAWITLCPLVLGAPSAANFINAPLHRPVVFSLKSSQVVGDLVFLNYNVLK